MNARTATSFAMIASLAMLSVVHAQDADDLEPAVDTSSYEPAVNTSAVEAASETSSIEPAVNTSVEASDDSAEEAAPIGQVVRSESGPVMDRMTLSRTEITGNQELPKVLYIVPWKKSDPGDLMGRPVNTLLDEVLAPIDREEFIRQVDFYGDLNGENDG